MRDDFHLDLVVAWLKQEGDLFAVKGAPLVVMACDVAIDPGNELSACEDVKACGVWSGIEMQVVEEVRRRG